MQRGRSRIVAVVLALLMGGAGCGAEAPTIPPPSGDRVVLIGVDAATWTVLRPLMAAGDLPHLKGLVDRGWSGVLMSMEPTLSPALWTTIATGRVPSEHGIQGFLAATEDGQEVPVTSNLRRVETLWTIATRAGRSVNVIGWYVTWPTEVVNGIMVADRVGPQREAGIVGGTDSFTDEHPGVYPERFVPTVMSLIVRPEDYLSRREREFHTRHPVHPVDETRTAIAEHVLAEHPADLSMIYLWGIDPMQHYFWKYHDPASWIGPPMQEGEAALNGDLVADYYRDTDAFVGRILARLRPTDTVLIVSDHGAGPITMYDPKKGISGDHRVEGVIIAAGPPIRHGTAAEPPSILDVTPTVLNLLGLPAGRDMPGRVIEEMLTPAWLEAHPPRRIATWEPENRVVDRWPIATKNDETIKEKLRSLGYIE
ncbi:MAG TPA: alkaline phosphatase family protein [Candidatus Limnocylindria bacterium]|nr:alkaline phosphatase family protein [Candidatus Limnocylindria bacterium]